MAKTVDVNNSTTSDSLNEIKLMAGKGKLLSNEHCIVIETCKPGMPKHEEKFFNFWKLVLCTPHFPYFSKN